MFTEPVEGPYFNSWSGTPLVIGGQTDVYIHGEGKTVEFDGVLSMNCEAGGSQVWLAAGNFFEGELDSDALANRVVPAVVVTKARALYCPK